MKLCRSLTLTVAGMYFPALSETIKTLEVSKQEISKTWEPKRKEFQNKMLDSVTFKEVATINKQRKFEKKRHFQTFRTTVVKVSAILAEGVLN